MLCAGRGLPGECGAAAGEPELSGPVEFDPVISRLVTVLAGDATRALQAIRGARAAARQQAWQMASAAARTPSNLSSYVM
jgi:hypothetical protein